MGDEYRPHNSEPLQAILDYMIIDEVNRREREQRRPVQDRAYMPPRQQIPGRESPAEPDENPRGVEDITDYGNIETTVIS
jgi:hypothetical protein